MLVDELTLLGVLRSLCLTIDAIGILIGLDLIIGAPIVRGINNLLNKVFDLDKTLLKPTSRIALGLLFMAVSLIMLYVALNAK
jgi:hypothetical protein